MSLSVGELPEVGPNQQQTMGLDFGSFLPEGVTLVGTPTLLMTTSFGTDDAAQSRVLVGPVIGLIPEDLNGTGIANTAVIFQVGNCLVGVRYVVDIYCPSSDGDVVEASAHFKCVRPT